MIASLVDAQVEICFVSNVKDQVDQLRLGQTRRCERFVDEALGRAAKSSRTRTRVHGLFAVPSWTDAGVCSPMPDRRRMWW
jgi:hypothetical protein